MEKLAELQGAGIINLRDANFTKTVLDGPRAYDALVLFTVTGSKYKCTACHAAEDALSTVQYTLRKASEQGTSALQGRRPIFVFRCGFETCQAPFALYGMRNAPTISFMPGSTKRRKFRDREATLDPQRTISPDGPHTAEAVLALLQLDEPLQVLKKPEAHILHSLAAAVLMALAATWVGGDARRLCFWRLPSAWMLGSFLVYAGGVSGLVYCVIRSPALLGADEKGRPQLFSPGGRDQYVLEGVFVGALTLAAAGAVVMLVRTAKAGRGDATNTIWGITLIGVVAALFLRLLQFYRLKTAWYNPAEQVPEGLSQAAADAWQWLRQHAQQYLGIDLQLLPDQLGVPKGTPLLPPSLKL